jgi:CubicO group peptidase (beta-lactamase class C family)
MDMQLSNDRSLATIGNDSLRANQGSLFGLAGDDYLRGTNRQGNVLFGNEGNDILRGGRKDDTFNGGSGNDRLFGYDGNDLLVGGSGDDYLSGGAGDDRLKGSAGKDQLLGDAGNDSLDGGFGLDTLNGGKGNDTLLDYYGGDRLMGGQGQDIFGVGGALSTAASVITDFKIGQDKIKVLRLGARFENLTFKDQNGGTIILDGKQVIAEIQGVRASQLKANSFIFGKAQLATELQTNLNQSLAADPTATGISSAIFAPDGTVWQGFAGLANRESNAPVDANSLFGIGSTTKPMVATVILQLMDEGKLKLSDTVSQWLPDLAKGIPNIDRITIRQLLGHTSGIQSYTDSAELSGEALFKDPSILQRQFTTKELIALVAGKPALFEPGQSFAYSNTNYTLLGEIVEKATGTNLATQLRSRIFEPLGMNQTFFASQESVNPDSLTRSYPIDQDGDGKLDYLNESLSWAGAAGAVVGTAADTAKFAQALFQGELLAPETLRMMIQDSSDIKDPAAPPDVKSYNYGLGIFSGNIGAGNQLDHGGDTIGWHSQMIYLPDRQITATVLATQLGSAEETARKNLQSTIQTYPGS